MLDVKIARDPDRIKLETKKKMQLNLYGCIDSINMFFGRRFSQRGRAATKKAFNPQISQITQIFQIINNNNSKSIGSHDLPSKN